ncbi:polyribonucleotide nucleotidyltransferase [Megasphaera hominis]|jgi:polyribonucleotide nucleotidyltransferase|uniref:Polyribonucleotide nucleotidyltransferase n=1 Tax=Megasphaera hominis TaxID=159836 RepID=A0ABR6VHR9_9FIRM|nr:polyribonucleotide nucleotidyltransferase [Megasphaera hominis]MBC3535776.1 polyribonucleotide nucleotidyltransferase [Megasphaera hominis]
MEKQVFQMDFAGRPLVIEVGQLAKQASGAALVRYGDTAVFVTATGSKEAREDADFFPLTVDYEEKMYSVGKIPGGFIKREGKPPESATLFARLIDRPIRPLFPKTYRHDVHVVAYDFCVDHDNAPEIAAMIGASVSLCMSHIPFAGPIAGVRVGRVDGKLICNPTVEQSEASDMDICVAGTKDAILMVEGGAKQVPEADILDAIMFAHDEIKKVVEWQESFLPQISVPKQEFVEKEPPADIVEAVHAYGEDKMKTAIFDADKVSREEKMNTVENDIYEHFADIYPDNQADVAEITQKMIKEIVRHMIAVDKIRPDGRKVDEVRPVSCEVGLFKRTHGTGLFTRGQTQVLSFCTLAPLSECQHIDGVGLETERRYMHHYNFPSFCVGETKSSRGPGRREIGHGKLAERALTQVMPSEEEFPYAIRVVSEVLESNGSSSMGSTCGSTLALMDAGVPIKAPVAGVAMGLVTKGDDFTILTDIQGMEDALGDMDFKVAGTTTGVTAIQMDIKIKGLSREILEQALKQAHEGRMFIMGKMLEAIDAPRQNLSQYAPRIITIHLNPDKIRDVIGPGGKMIKQITEETGAKIDIDDSGLVYIASVEAAGGEKAKKWIEDLTKDVVVGETYVGKVTRLMAFGAFVEVLPGKEGLVHISQLAKERVEKVEDVVNVGDEIMVKCIEIDEKGRINLSRKALLGGGDGPAHHGNNHGGHGNRPRRDDHKR